MGADGGSGSRGSQWQLCGDSCSRDLTTPLATVIGWFWSPEHRANTLSADYRETGIGVVAGTPAELSTDRPAAIYTQEFGVRSG